MSIFGRKSQTTQQLADEIGRGTLTGNSPARSVNLVKQAGPANQRVDVEKRGGVDFVKKFDRAGASLLKRDLTGIRGDVSFYLDNSLSMGPDYNSPDNKLQVLTERAAAWALNVDTDGKLPFYPWDDNVHTARDGSAPVVATLDNLDGLINREVRGKFRMGGTNMTTMLLHILETAKTATAPQFVFIVGDGNPNVQVPGIIPAIAELSRYPVWLKFIAIKPVPYLDELDDLENTHPGVRLIDNVDTKTVLDPVAMSDKDFAEAMTDELDTWISAAQAARILV
jgi:hypothetical protein